MSARGKGRDVTGTRGAAVIHQRLTITCDRDGCASQFKPWGGDAARDEVLAQYAARDSGWLVRDHPAREPHLCKLHRDVTTAKESIQ